MDQNEKFYVRNNTSKTWAMNNKGYPIQFSSRPIAKQYADKYLRAFTIVSLNLQTRQMRWQGGMHVI